MYPGLFLFSFVVLFSSENGTRKAVNCGLRANQKKKGPGIISVG
jgi:hypothetical protein